MILKIETEITGNFLIEKDMKTKYHPFDIDIRFDLENEKYYISLCKKVIDYSSYLPKTKIRKGKIEPIEFSSEDFLTEQFKILQHIESFGAIDKNISSIKWNKCSIEWIPESDKEKNDLSIKKYKRNLKYDSEPKTITKDWIFNTIIHRKRLNHLALPFSFLKEGINFYHKFQYQQSFIHSYLMLEGFFGNGEFKNKKIKSEFRKSQILIKSINTTIQYLENIKGKHFEWFIFICKKYNKQPDENGVIHFLVELRGNLSHFSLEKPEKYKNPFKDKDFESLAFIAMTICMYSSTELRLEPFRKKKLYS